MHRLLSVLLACSAVALLIGAVRGEDLTLQPPGSDFTKPVGDAILITCKVAGAKENATYDLRWLSDDDKEITDRTGSRRYVEDDDAATKKLYLTKITNEDSGKYSCVATIGGQQQKKTVTLHIFKDITFDNVPLSQNPVIHTDALIRCVVSGNPKPEVTWRYGGKRIQTGGRYVLEDSKGLTIKNITKADDGQYTCRAEVEAHGRLDDRKIDVVVHIPPKIVEDQLKVEGTEDTEAAISCTADGLPKPTYKFYKGDGKAELQSTDNVIVDETAGRVQFKPLKKADEGRYTCRATNDAGNDTATGQLNVLVKPHIHELNDLTDKEGGTATLTCRSRGDPTPIMTFRKGDGEPIKSHDRIVVSDGFNGLLQLTIKHLVADDAANYTCRSVNALGHHEKTASLTVQYAPKFAPNHTRTMFAWAGSTRNVTCRATGEPSPKLEWLVRDIVLGNNDTYHIYDLGSTSHLSVKVKEDHQSWIYTNIVCRATNKLGVNSQQIELKRASVPSIPSSLNVTKRMTTMLTLNVEAPEDDGGMPIVGYRVEYDGKTIYEVDAPTDGNIRIENLHPNTNYTLLVSAKTEVGSGQPKQIVVATEPIRKPYPIVITSDAHSSSAFQYKITWQQPDTGGKPITQYAFKWRQVIVKDVNDSRVAEAVSPDWIVKNRDDDPAKPMVEFDLDGLTPNSTYQLVVMARNEIDWSEPSEQFTFTTSKATAEELSRAVSSASAIGVGAVVGITIVILIIILVVVDVSCYFVNSCGVTMIVCTRVCGQNATFSKEKAAEEGESKEALTKCPPPQEVNNAAIPATQETANEAPAGGDIDKKPLLPDSEQPDDDEKKKLDEPVKTVDEKEEETKDAEKEDVKEKTPLVEEVAEEKKGEAPETG